MATTPSVADMFAARLAALEQQDRESQAKTRATLARLHALVADLKALELPLA